MSKISGLVLAGAAAALLASGFVSTASAAGNGDVRCVGGNACKGSSECSMKSDKSGCKGQNACKGKGWATMSAKDCAKIDGAKAEPMKDEKK